MNKETILITGVGGFVGTHVFKYLIENFPEHNYIAFIHLSSNHYPVYESIKNNYPFVKIKIGAVENFQTLERIFIEEQVTLVIHLAAQAIVQHAEKNHLATIQTNIVGTANILELNHVYKTRLLYQSTDKVYGEKENAKHYDPLAPIDFYGTTKASAELLVKYYQTQYHDQITVLRPCNLFGLDHNLQRLIPDIIMSCLRKENPVINYIVTPNYETILPKPISEDAHFPKRQFLYIRDYCEFIGYFLFKRTIELMDMGSKETKQYPVTFSTGKHNLGTPFIYSTKELAELILDFFPGLTLKYRQTTYTREIKNQSLADELTKQMSKGFLLTPMEEALKNTILEYANYYKKDLIRYYESEGHFNNNLITIINKYNWS